ncbi:unnamed protein product [Discula destructiva]
MIARNLCNRAFTIIIISFVSAIVLLLTAKRLDHTSWDTGTSLNTGNFRPHNAHGGKAKPKAYATTTATRDALIEATDAAHPQDARPASTKILNGNTGEDLASTKQHGLQSTLAHSRDPVCDGFPDTSSILLIMKTGATESYDKLPVQIMTVLKCLPDFLLFSDLEQHIGGYHVRDSLETVLSEAKEGNPDFDLYRAQQDCVVNQDDCSKVLEGAEWAGWNLDKYKNIHMAEKAYRLRPDYDWYIFVDADTYVSWPNMVYALKKLDPAEERYLGVPTVIGDKLFAHGGSGYVVSRAAMKEFVGKQPGIANKWDVDIRNHCCGDFVFAQALNESLGILVEGFWPLSNGEKPFSTPYGPNTWCHAVGMMHHMNSEEISSFWEFERKRYRTNPKPLVFSEVYEEFFGSKLQPVREDWDNASDDWFYIDLNRPEYTWEEWRKDRAVKGEKKKETEKVAHASWESCRVACLEHNDCFQFSWHNECCAMHRSFKLGKPMKKEAEETMRTISGWNVDKMKRWIAQEGQCGDRVEWPELMRSVKD